MLTNIVNKLKTWLLQLRDVRMLGLLAFLVIVLLVSWSGVNVIQTNYDLEKQVSKLQQENDVQQLANNNLKLRNEYYNTDTYLELSARKQFGKAAPGETVLIVPKGVALAHTVDVPQAITPAATKVEAQLPAYQKNLQAWFNFFLRRNQN